MGINAESSADSAPPSDRFVKWLTTEAAVETVLIDELTYKTERIRPRRPQH